ncbi:MAG: DUF3348 family protein [Pseudomonadota bacterium]|nr:DUF3348 family protein [Pseudomonadota bacterium]OZB16377.1 MAG: hypothetical protein B7X58_05385 [Marinobacter sp. 34-60-7]
MPNPSVEPRPSAHSLLNQLAAPDGNKPAGALPCLGERLGRLFGLADTMALDKAMSTRNNVSPSPALPLESLINDLITARRALHQKIREYPQSPVVEARDAEPDLNADVLLNRWLLLHRKVAATANQLRDRVRKALQSAGGDLARLAELDAVFDHTMAAYASQNFGQVTRVVEQQIAGLFNDTAPCHPDPLQSVCTQAQSLLMAELDVRLEPVLGLLEACQHKEAHA